ncbi:MAG: futalosine hydrolase [Bacteroidales bacterium]
MSFKILYITATGTEADALKKISGMIPFKDGFLFGSIEISLLIAGVGSISTAWAIKKWLSAYEKPDLAINSGIAGSYNDELNIGDVVMPVSDCFADSGIEDGENFFTLSEAGLSEADEFPYKNGLLYTDARFSDKMKGILKPVRAITVNSATGSEITRNKLLKKFNPDIETMEGATFFYICSREDIPFLAVRAISNKVEIRNKNNWNISLALNNLSERLIDVLLTL